MQTVIVASTNPVKIVSARNGLVRIFPGQQFEVRGISVESGVGDQPMSDDETYQGAWNRASNAQLAVPGADLWLGIEGGLEVVGSELQGFAWVVVRGARAFRQKPHGDLYPAGRSRHTGASGA